MTKIRQILFFVLILSCTYALAQRSSTDRVLQKSASLATAVNQVNTAQKSGNNGTGTGGGMNPYQTTCDTLLNIDLGIDTLTNYTLNPPNWGYVAGNNSFGDIAKAEFYNYSGPATQLTGIIYGFGRGAAASPASVIQVTVWDDNAGVPGAILGTQPLPLSLIAASVTAGLPVPVTLTTPINITGPYYIGIEFGYAAGDTVALITNRNNNTPAPGTAWEQWSDLSWHAYSDPTSWGLNVSSFAAPILCTTTTLTANFSASPTLICTGQTVNYTDLSTGNPTSYNWSFPGGTPPSSTQPNPAVVYSTPGTYSATLIVSDGTTLNTSFQPNLITVTNCTPGCDTLSNIDAADTLTIYTVAAPGWGYVAGHNSYDDIAKAEYYNYVGPATQLTGILYGFGVGAAANASSVVRATVWADNAGVPGAALATQNISLQTIAADVALGNLTAITFATPIAITGPFYVGIEFSYAPGDTVALITNRNNNSPAPGTAWEQWSDLSWHAYSETPASWGINVSSFVMPILCSPSGLPPLADFSADVTTACTNVPVNFTSTSTGNPSTYNWSFPGGTPATSTAMNPSVTYTAPGTYSVTLSVTNPFGSDTEVKSNYIVISNCAGAPNPSFNANAVAICSGQSISYYNTTTGAPTSYSWAFQGGVPSTSTAMNPIVNYPNAGDFSVTLIAYNANGSNAANQVNYIHVDSSANASFTYAGTGNGNVQFTNTSTGKAPLSYVWTFQGATPNSSTQTNPTTTYPTNGTFTAYLTASNSCGVNTYTSQITIDIVGLTDAFEGMLQLYPNPNEGNFVIEMKNSEIKSLSFALSDVQGKILHTEEIALSSGSIKHPISLPNLAAGTYFAKISTANKTANFKVVIQK